MPDSIEIIGEGSLIQHGKLNDRIYLMKLDRRDSGEIIDKLNLLTNQNDYAKIFCKVPKSLSPLFIGDGYVMEAYIPNFYQGEEDVFFMSKFRHKERCNGIESDKLSALSNLLSERDSINLAPFENYKSDYLIRRLDSSDVEQITEIYSKVFESYPFPINNPEYILQTMKEDVQYFGAEIKGKLVALASSEIDTTGLNAEMTDFATLPNHQGKRLSILLLISMEKSMRKQGIKTLYTIARTNSIAMNKTFIRMHYDFSGTLVMNTNIAGKIESMNVYYKQL